MSETLNLYLDITNYMMLHEALHKGDPMPEEKKYFLLAINLRATRFNAIFKWQNLGKNSFMRTVKTASDRGFISGPAVKDGMMTYSINGNITTLLIDDGNDSFSVAMHTAVRIPIGTPKSSH